MSIRICPRCGRMSFDEDRQRNEWRCTVRSCNYCEPIKNRIDVLESELASIHAEMEAECKQQECIREYWKQRAHKAEAQVQRVRDTLNFARIGTKDYFQGVGDLSRDVRAALEVQQVDDAEKFDCGAALGAALSDNETWGGGDG